MAFPKTAAVAAGLVLAGCSPGPTSPTAATVDGETISLSALQTEMKATGVADDTPAIRAAVLDRIVTRKLLAKAARDRGLDKAPDAETLKAMATETVEASLLQRSVAAKAGAPSPQEVAQFANDHPEMFAHRTVYLVEQVRLATRPDAALGKALAPVNTLEELIAVLQARGVAFTRAMDELDTLRADPRLSAQVARLGPGELFVTPTAQGVAINRVRAAKPVRLPDTEAAKLAAQLLRQQRMENALTAEVAAIKAQAAKKITYGAGYGPPSAPAPAPKS